jgi:hypothetical protein
MEKDCYNNAFIEGKNERLKELIFFKAREKAIVLST